MVSSSSFFGLWMSTFPQSSWDSSSVQIMSMSSGLGPTPVTSLGFNYPAKDGHWLDFGM